MKRIALINGSVQPTNYTSFALRILKNSIKQNKDFEVIEINLKDFTLPFPGETIPNNDSVELQNLLKSADAFILGTPEYNGTFTAKLKLMIENSGYPSPMKGRPASLIGVASGTLGAVKSLEHLRSVCAHIGSFVLPRVVSIAEVEKKFDKINGNCLSNETENEVSLIFINLLDYFKLS